MRVLHLLDHSLPLHSGYTFRTQAIINGLKSLGYDSFQLTGCKQGTTAVPLESCDGLKFYRTSGAESWTARLPALGQLDMARRMRRRLREVITEWRPDILHAHSPCLNGLAALSMGLPVVYEVRAFWEDAAVDHGTSRQGSVRYRLTRALETYVLKRADAATTICQGLRADIVARGIEASKVTVVPNCVDIDAFPLLDGRDVDLAARLALDGRIVLGFIGSFYAYEGLDLLIAALPRLLAANSQVSLLLAGGGPEEARLKRLAQELGVMSHCRFVGRVPHGDVRRYYSLLDACVLPRRAMRLTELVTPLKPLEAMALGIPVLASNVGGHKELLRDGVTGILFEADDVRALADAALAWIARPERRAQVAEARRYVERERTWSRNIELYRSVYAQALSARRVTAPIDHA
jgi:PEP-CTERM/exosortase A-associated glycosyltransferase